MTGVDCVIESEILDLFINADGEIDLNKALTALMYVVAGLCCQSSRPSSAEVAVEFAVKLRQLVASHATGGRLH